MGKPILVSAHDIKWLGLACRSVLYSAMGEGLVKVAGHLFRFELFSVVVLNHIIYFQYYVLLLNSIISVS